MCVCVGVCVGLCVGGWCMYMCVLVDGVYVCGCVFVCLFDIVDCVCVFKSECVCVCVCARECVYVLEFVC